MNAEEKDLLHRHLNGDLDAAEEAAFLSRLQESPELRRELASQAMDEMLVSELVLEKRSAARPVARRRPWIPVSIAAAMLIGLTMLLLRGNPAPASIRVTSVSGEARVERQDGSHPLQLGDTVREGDRIVTGRGEVAFGGVELGTQTTVFLHAKGMTVNEGRIRAHVAAGEQFRGNSQRVHVNAHPGIVRMTVSPLRTRVEAEEGIVEVQASGSPVRLSAGEYASVGVRTETGRVVDRARVRTAVDLAVAFLASRGSDLVLPMASEKRGGAQPRRTYAELALLALHRAGVPDSDPLKSELLGFVKGRAVEATYVAALQAIALAEIDPVAHHERIRLCAQLLADSQCANGQWDYAVKAASPDVPATGRIHRRREGPPSGDNSVTSYAVLGLHACLKAGVEVDPDLLARARAWWVKCQNEDGGWGYNDSGARSVNDAGNRTLTTNASYGSATASAIASLAAIREMRSEDAGTGAAIGRGLEWLGARFAADRNPGKDPGFAAVHWLVAASRAGQLLGVEKFGSHEWHREGAEFLLQAQKPSGAWTVEKGEFMAHEKNDVLDTCLALLFLLREDR